MRSRASRVLDRSLQLYAPLDHAKLFSSIPARQRLKRDFDELQSTLKSLQPIEHPVPELAKFVLALGGTAARKEPGRI